MSCLGFSVNYRVILITISIDEECRIATNIKKNSLCLSLLPCQNLPAPCHYNVETVMNLNSVQHNWSKMFPSLKKMVGRVVGEVTHI